ncbi:MAG: ribosomal protein S18-alanine N-acetyltransferase [Acidobacteria bacterium]|nr:ribosomal protein S18-alanine N-acetyltransferase [Acidobacteriota bacterium]
MEVSITQMLVRHIPSVVELERFCQLNSRGESSYEKLCKEQNSVLLVALNANSEVIGCFSGWLVADELEVDNVAVAPNWRRAEVATKLFAEAQQIALKRGATQAFLEVRSSNTAARSLYEKQGFTVVGRRKNYYLDPLDDALILAKKIAGPLKQEP